MLNFVLIFVMVVERSRDVIVNYLLFVLNTA